MKQNSYCTEVGVLPGTDFRVQPKYMDMLNLQEAWSFGRGGGQRVAVIDTGVTPHPRFSHLIPGGDTARRSARTVGADEAELLLHRGRGVARH